MVPDASRFLQAFPQVFFIFQIFRHFLARKFQFGYVQEYHQKHLDVMTHQMRQPNKKEIFFTGSDKNSACSSNSAF